LRFYLLTIEAIAKHHETNNVKERNKSKASECMYIFKLFVAVAASFSKKPYYLLGVEEGVEKEECEVLDHVAYNEPIPGFAAHQVPSILFHSLAYFEELP